MSKKAGKLAGLAALGALGYMLTRDKSKEDAGDQKTSSYTGDTKKVEAKDVDYGNEGRRTSMAVSPTASAKQRVSSAAGKATGSPDSEAGMSRGTRAADARAAEAGMSRGTRTTSTAGAGRGSVNPSSVTASDARAAEAGMSRGTRSTSMAGSGRGTVNPSSVTASDARAAEAGMSRGSRATSMAGSGRGSVNPDVVKPSGARDLEAGMSRGRREMPSGPGQSTVDAVRNLQSAAKVPSSMAGRPGYDEAGRRLPSNAGMPGFDEAGNPMKKGGKVKKMASGGMTASSRADGIASRGKTKCKMY